MIWLRLFIAALALALVLHFLAPPWDQLPHVAWFVLPALVVVHAVPVLLCGLAWACVLPQAKVGLVLFGRWARDGFNEILAMVPLAGEAAGMHLLTRHGIIAGLAGASMIADLTAEILAQALFTLGGVVLWGLSHGIDQLWRWGLPGVLAAGGAVLGFIAVQRGGGIRWAEHLAARWLSRPGLDQGIHAHLMDLYRRPARCAGAVALHALAWVAACAEAWLALRLLGNPISPLQAIMLESAIFALRSAAFFVPGALGLQEGGYALLGPLLGLSPATAITLSLLKRGREVVMGGPAILAWIWFSRRRLPAGRDVSLSSDRM